jgi:AcrR family transcriptional regulator
MGRPPGQLSEDTRKAILAAARDSFAQLGFERATNREIAAAAGVTAAAMYRHFESKPELYAAVVHDALGELVPHLRRSIASASSARASFRALIETLEKLSDRQRAAARFLAELPAEMQRHPQISRRVLDDPGEVLAIVGEIVEAGVRANEISQDKAQRVVSIMIASFMGVSAYANTLGPSLGKEAIAGFIDLLENQLFMSPQR